MYKRANHVWMRFGVLVAASAVLGLVIACSVNAPVVAPGAAQPTSAPTGMAQMELMPTHQPRRHSGEHVPGLGDPIDAPHFVDSFPNHSQTLTQSPSRVGVNFDVALGGTSRITVEQAGKEIPTGEMQFDSRKIYLSTTLPANIGDGLYLVKYRACFADSGCSDGQFGFQVDAARVKNFLDLTTQKEVTIHLKEIKLPAESDHHCSRNKSDVGE